jgi:polyphosphate kinase
MSVKGLLNYTQNRELSWLKFNERVLEEAQDKSVPILERQKFISIFSNIPDPEHVSL